MGRVDELEFKWGQLRAEGLSNREIAERIAEDQQNVEIHGEIPMDHPANGEPYRHEFAPLPDREAMPQGVSIAWDGSGQHLIFRVKWEDREKAWVAYRRLVRDGLVEQLPKEAEMNIFGRNTPNLGPRGGGKGG